MCFRNWTYTLFYVAAELWVRRALKRCPGTGSLAPCCSRERCEL